MERQRNLNFSMLFDVHRWSEHPEIGRHVDLIYESHFQDDKRTSLTKRHIKVLLLALYVAWKVHPDLCVAIHMSPNGYKAGTRYNALSISDKTIKVVKRLVEVGLLGFHKGWQDTRTGKGRLSRIWPTSSLERQFHEAKYGVADVIENFGRETIVLRNSDGDDIPYTDTADTTRMREVLTRYNTFLARFHVDLPEADGPFIRTGDGVVFTGDAYKFMYRVFNDGSWTRGGRFYGPFWQSLPDTVRTRLRIDDMPLVEVDYSAFHPVLMYAGAGIDYWTEIDRDPYAFLRPELLDRGLDRAFVKRTFLIMVNAKSEKSAFKGIQSEFNSRYKGVSLKFDLLRVVLDDMRMAHPKIADRLCSGAGIDLMYTDSRILECLLETFMDKEIPLLPVHDSVLVPFQYGELLWAEMKRAFHKITGINSVRLKQDAVSKGEWSNWRHQDFALYLAYMTEILAMKPSQGYLERQRAHRDKLHRMGAPVRLPLWREDLLR